MWGLCARGKAAAMGLVTDIRLSRKPLMGFVAIGLAWAAYFAQMPAILARVGASDGAYGLAVLWGSFGALGAMWLAPACRRLAGAYANPLAIVLLAAGMFGAGASQGLVALPIYPAWSPPKPPCLCWVCPCKAAPSMASTLSSRLCKCLEASL